MRVKRLLAITSSVENENRIISRLLYTNKSLPPLLEHEAAQQTITLAQKLMKLGYNEQARLLQNWSITLIRRTVECYRRRYKPLLALGLYSLAENLELQGKQPEAIKVVKEAMQIDLQLFSQRSETYRPRLQRWIRKAFDWLTSSGQQTDALELQFSLDQLDSAVESRSYVAVGAANVTPLVNLTNTVVAHGGYADIYRGVLRLRNKPLPASILSLIDQPPRPFNAFSPLQVAVKCIRTTDRAFANIQKVSPASYRLWFNAANTRS
jgi:tetratricopeptide (TPR) repeat protein